MVEETVGRESEGITPAKANCIRALRANSKEQSNRQRREVLKKEKAAKENRLTIKRLWTLYDDEKKTRRVRKTDIGFYNNHLQFFSEMTPEELSTADMEKLKKEKTKGGLSPQTIKHILALLKRLIAYGVKNGMCDEPSKSKLQIIFPKVDNKKTETMTVEQYARFLKALDEEKDQDTVAFIKLALYTGMRKGALMALKWEDVDLNNDFITLRGESAKSGKTEKIPISNLVHTLLDSIKRTESPFVFPGKNGGQRRDFKRIAERVRDNAGLPKDFRPLHGLRHVFASMLASSGKVDLFTLQKLLTHNSPEMTQRYAHLADEALKRAARVSDDVFAVKGENQ
jgi:integrase